MNCRQSKLALVWPIVFAAVAASCGKAPPPAAPPPLTIAAAPGAKKAPMTFTVSPDVNPDSSGRPSPIVVRIYQLKAEAAFKATDFFTLYDDEQKALGPELISRDEYVLAPKETKTIDVALSPDTRFVGAIAAFRDYRNAEWRVLVPAPKKGISVAVERARIVLTGGV